MALYNTTYYNADQYNITADLLALQDTVTPTDADVTKSVTLPRQDAMTEADTLGHNIGPDEIMDMILLVELRTSSIEFPRADTLALVETFSTLLDVTAFLETITLTDTMSQMPDVALFDFLFTEDFIQIQFTNKALNDILRVADWLSIERTPVNNEWYD